MPREFWRRAMVDCRAEECGSIQMGWPAGAWALKKMTISVGDWLRGPIFNAGLQAIHTGCNSVTNQMLSVTV